MLRIKLTDARQETSIINTIQGEREDEYRELSSTAELPRGDRAQAPPRPSDYTEFEESDADLARYKKWLAAIRARQHYFDAPGGEEAAAAVASCEEALARFESEALSAELDESPSDARPVLRAVDEADR